MCNARKERLPACGRPSRRSRPAVGASHYSHPAGIRTLSLHHDSSSAPSLSPLRAQTTLDQPKNSNSGCHQRPLSGSRCVGDMSQQEYPDSRSRSTTSRSEALSGSLKRREGWDLDGDGDGARRQSN